MRSLAALLLAVVLAVCMTLGRGAKLAQAGGVLLSGPKRAPCRSRICTLPCMLSVKLCRKCCKSLVGGGDLATTPSSYGDYGDPAFGNGTNRPDYDDSVPLLFPDKLPEGTQDAMLETAAHILAIVSGEDPERIRIWVDNPQRNLDNLGRLATKLSSFPRAPFGRAYWQLVLRSSKDRPFTLLREALAVRAAYLQGASPTSGPSPSTASNGGSGGNGGDDGNTAASSAASDDSSDSTDSSASTDATSDTEASSESRWWLLRRRTD